MRLVVCPALSATQRACLAPIPGQRLSSQRPPRLRGFCPSLNLDLHYLQLQFGPDAARFAQDCRSTTRKHTPFLALCFDGVRRLHDPTVLLAFSRRELVTQVVKVLGHRCVPYSPRQEGEEWLAAAPCWLDLFGTQCEVFVVPTDGSDQNLVEEWEEAVGTAMPWRWSSNSFALLFTAPFAQAVRREQDVNDKISARQMEEMLEDQGFFLHSSVLRQVLHAGGWNVLRCEQVGHVRGQSSLETTIRTFMPSTALPWSSSGASKGITRRSPTIWSRTTVRRGTSLMQQTR